MMEAIVKTLREAIGLDASSIGLGAIERAVQYRMEAANICSTDEYAACIGQTSAELRALIEAVVVPETWFFRDPGAFIAAVEWARRIDPSTRLKILSVPCATGEEPYSLAMAFLDAGIAPERFEIEAVDVSNRVVHHAAAGVFGRNSFRGKSLEFRERYFSKAGSEYVLDARVKKLVTFRQANLLEDFAFHAAGTYRAIFCRNLLIYFDAEIQARALKILRRLLASDGLCFVAPAESGLMLRHEFAPAGYTQAFAFRKTASRRISGICLLRPARVPIARRTAAVPPQPPAKARNVTVTQPVPALPDPVAPPQGLEVAVQLANEGRFAEVAEICDAFLKAHGASADAYCLLAIVSDASDRADEAASLYRKALYLDPEHHDALVHFSLLAGRMGDTATAEALRKRAMRIESNSSTA